MVVLVATSQLSHHPWNAGCESRWQDEMNGRHDGTWPQCDQQWRCVMCQRVVEMEAAGIARGNQTEIASEVFPTGEGGSSPAVGQASDPRDMEEMPVAPTSESGDGNLRGDSSTDDGADGGGAGDAASPVGDVLEDETVAQLGAVAKSAVSQRWRIRRTLLRRESRGRLPERGSRVTRLAWRSSMSTQLAAPAPMKILGGGLLETGWTRVAANAVAG